MGWGGGGVEMAGGHWGRREYTYMQTLLKLCQHNIAIMFKPINRKAWDLIVDKWKAGAGELGLKGSGGGKINI